MSSITIAAELALKNLSGMVYCENKPERLYFQTCVVYKFTREKI